MALRDENKWQMVLRNIPELKKYGSQKGKRKDTLAKSTELLRQPGQRKLQDVAENTLLLWGHWGA